MQWSAVRSAVRRAVGPHLRRLVPVLQPLRRRHTEGLLQQQALLLDGLVAAEAALHQQRRQLLRVLRGDAVSLLFVRQPQLLVVVEAHAADCALRFVPPHHRLDGAGCFVERRQLVRVHPPVDLVRVHVARVLLAERALDRQRAGLAHGLDADGLGRAPLEVRAPLALVARVGRAHHALHRHGHARGAEHGGLREGRPLF